jgi:hypothetical protein
MTSLWRGLDLTPLPLTTASIKVRTHEPIGRKVAVVEVKVNLSNNVLIVTFILASSNICHTLGHMTSTMTSD